MDMQKAFGQRKILLLRTEEIRFARDQECGLTRTFGICFEHEPFYRRRESFKSAKLKASDLRGFFATSVVCIW